MASLRFGLVGTGYWAFHTHGTALASTQDAELVGVWGRNEARAADIADRMGARVYSEYDDLLSDVDAVAMAVPPDVQVGFAIRAAEAGRHLLLEKPLALDLDSASRLVDTIKANGVACLVFVTNRYWPGSEDWLRTAAEAGPWHSAHLVHYANIFQPGNPYSSSAWRRERGALWDIGPHALGSVVPLLGPIRSVTARRGPAGSDTIHLILGHATHENVADPELVQDHCVPGHHESGPISTVSLSLTMPQPSTANEFVAYGTHGVRARPEAHFEAEEAFRHAVYELKQLVGTGQREHRCDAQAGLATVRVLSAAEESADSGATIYL